VPEGPADGRTRGEAVKQMQESRRAVRAEAALAEARRQVEAVQHALLSSGPLIRFLKLYDQLDGAAEPLTGRQLERSTRPHPYDRPLPHISTVDARRTERQVDRAVGRLSDRIADFLNGECRFADGMCLACGQADRQGRPAYRRRMAEQFLKVNLASGPVAEEHVRCAASGLGFSRQTLRRAADRLGVRRCLEDGQWCWQLEDT